MLSEAESSAVSSHGIIIFATNTSYSLRGHLIDAQSVDIGGTMLTAVIDQFEQYTDEKSFLQ